MILNDHKYVQLIKSRHHGNDLSHSEVTISQELTDWLMESNMNFHSHRPYTH